MREASGAEAAATAFEEIMAAIANYEAMRPPVRGADGMTPGEAPSVAAIRRDLEKLEHAVSSVQGLIHGLSPGSRHLLARTAGLGLSELDRAMRPAVKLVRRAVRKAKKLPDKHSNTHRDHLAADIARVMRNTLRIEPTQTRDDPGITRSRGGGAYAHILRAALAVVGIKQFSIGAVMKGGLYLLDDPNGARGDRLPDADAAK
jgi:hypothetical protein